MGKYAKNRNDVSRDTLYEEALVYCRASLRRYDGLEIGLKSGWIIYSWIRKPHCSV